uniref:DUF4408 domain-containing protein n=1 Tax=Leersia perrieri TaxID=77586 RepID=A0A0D9WB49_9ORYZ
MSYSYGASTRRDRAGMSSATVVAAKVAFAAAAVAGAGSFARLAVPQLVSVAGAVFPRVWDAARVWLVPPYLFVTVHLIILVIWKLSDHKHFHKDPWPHPSPSPAMAPAAAAEDAPPPSINVKPKEEEEVFDAGVDYGVMPEISPDSGAGESCVTTESSDEDAASYTSDARRSLAPVLLQRELSLPTAAAVDGGGDDDDDMDATWKAIMRKTRPAAAAAAMADPAPAQKAAAMAPPPPRARDPSVGAEEMNRRFDDFIKKNRHSFGRQ